MRIASGVCSSRINIAAVIADANADSATRTGVMRSGVAPTGEANAIPAEQQRPPQAAVSSRAAGSAEEPQRRGRHHRQRRAGVKAEDMRLAQPGLRITVCNSSPATPSAAPVAPPPAAPGRSSTIIR